MYMILVGVLICLHLDITEAVQQDAKRVFFFFLVEYGICKLRREAELPTWGKYAVGEKI